jgi:predicted RNA methylase
VARVTATPDTVAAEAPRARRGTTKAGGRKHALDKFYTRSDVAAACLARLDLGAYTRIIEPSAGAGAFTELLLAAGASGVESYDLAPEHPAVVEQDWFTYAVTVADGRTLVVGNPPYGQQNNLAIRFINHAFDVVGADTVAFVLPRSFRKASVIDRVTRHAHIIDEVALGANSFELDGQPYDLPAIFQVWQRSDTPRPANTAPTTSAHFEFVKKGEPHHFAIRRVGGRAGHAFIDDEHTSVQSNYFIRLHGDPDDTAIADAITFINHLDLSVADDGVGPRTLSKRELVAIHDSAKAA